MASRGDVHLVLNNVSHIPAQRVTRIGAPQAVDTCWGDRVVPKQCLHVIVYDNFRMALFLRYGAWETARPFPESRTDEAYPQPSQTLQYRILFFFGAIGAP